MRIGILGGDMRQIALAEYIMALGLDVSMYGFDSDIMGKMCPAPIFCENAEAAASGADAIILPLPPTFDGIYLNCPLSSGKCKIKISEMLEFVSRETLILGGRMSPLLKQQISSLGNKCIDYYDREEVQIKNAVPSAEGALEIAMHELPITISGSHSAVLGYGRIGKILADMLKKLDSQVTVAARKRSDLATAQSRGLNTLAITHSGGVNSLEKLSDGYDVIFNTVPAWIIDGSVLSVLQKSTLIIDVASAPFGVDERAAEEAGIRVIRAQSLPGKVAPVTAGRIIAETVVQILFEEGLMT